MKTRSALTVAFVLCAPCLFAVQPSKRDFAANGTVTLSYPNGDRLQVLRDGTETWTYAKGGGSRESGSSAPEPTPPALPEAQLKRWAEGVSGSLMAAIESLFADNKAALQRYKAYEANKPMTQMIDMRANLLYNLTRDH